MYETELYEPVKKLLEDMGFTVSAEAKDCDIAAQLNGQLYIAELKTSFNLKLVYQIVERQTVCRYVYAAIPKPENTRSKKWNETVRLLKRLGAGLILVTVSGDKKYAEIALEPQKQEYNNSKKAKKLKNELAGRTVNMNTGGSKGKKIVTAYRENAVFIACCLQEKGDMTCAEIKKYGTGEKTYSILRNNFYGWFKKGENGLYSTTTKWLEERDEYKQITDIYTEKIKSVL